jgi:outer membrane lipoprotein-sorting protein
MSLHKLKLAAALVLAATGSLALALGYARGSGPEPPPAADQAAAPAARAPVAETPARVLSRMARTYAAARSYEDEGEVTVKFVGPVANLTVKKPFSTKFVRPNLYRYEFTEGAAAGAPRRFVIWTDGAPGRSRMWWTLKPQTQEGSLMNAIASGTGISNGSAINVPSLLMPDVIQGSILSGLKESKVVGDEAVDGVPCIKVEGKNARGDAQTVWIDKATSLVRKVFGTFQVPGAAVEQTTVYKPRIDVEIPPGQFTFEPPNP